MFEFIREKSPEVPEDFVRQYVKNHEARDKWMQSYALYDWVAPLKPRYSYHDFLKEFCYKLNESDIKLPDASIAQESNKKLFMVSQKGVRTFMMQLDRETSDYYATVEESLFDYFAKKQKE